MTIPSGMPGSKISSAPDLFSNENGSAIFILYSRPNGGHGSSNENGFAIFISYARPNGGHGRLTERTIRKEIGKDESPGLFLRQ